MLNYVYGNHKQIFFRDETESVSLIIKKCFGGNCDVIWALYGAVNVGYK